MQKKQMEKHVSAGWRGGVSVPGLHVQTNRSVNESPNGIFYDDLQHKINIYGFVDGCWQWKGFLAVKF